MADFYTYRVTWSPEEERYRGFCAEFPTLSWTASSPDEAFSGIRHLVSEVLGEIREDVARTVGQAQLQWQVHGTGPSRDPSGACSPGCGGRGQPEPAGQCAVERTQLSSVAVLVGAAGFRFEAPATSRLPSDAWRGGRAVYGGGLENR